MILCNCGQEIQKGETHCRACGSDQIVKQGMFGWALLGFIGGLFVPSLLDFIAVVFLSDKRVKEDFLNPTIIGRSRWAATRKGIIAGAITQILLIIGLIITLSFGMIWISTELYC